MLRLFLPPDRLLSEPLGRRRDQALAVAKEAEGNIATLRRAVEIMEDRPAAPVSAPAARRSRSMPPEIDAEAFHKGLLEALRDAPGSLTSAEATAISLARLGVTEMAVLRGHLAANANNALTRYVRRGVVRRIQVEGAPLRWEVARFLSHRLHRDYAAVLDAACEAWNRLTPERLQSLTSYPWLPQVSS